MEILTWNLNPESELGNATWIRNLNSKLGFLTKLNISARCNSKQKDIRKIESEPHDLSDS